ncbi:MAG: hypothetical protein GEU87_18140 [Alphaproteobacteria bacterium]|nr:hypothetical protein [Alphaproteobacteria bacterium]
MSASGESAIRETLPPEAWEERLVAHYLRSDGPFGGVPLTFLDATPAELASASGIGGISELAAQRAFLAHFNRNDVHRWLSGDRGPPVRDREVPTYFRYLILTCLVTATETGAGGTRNFRIRLGELLEEDSPFNSVFGVNTLWRNLAAWCERRRAAGEPFRRVVLPPFGSMNLIGHAVRIAFPSWQDRRVLTQILRILPATTRRTPERLVQELSRQKYADLLSDAVASAVNEFGVAVRSRRRMLLGHRLWRLVESIDARLAENAEGIVRERLHLQATFGGYEQDVLYLALFLGRAAADASPEWEGSIGELEKLSRNRMPAALAEGLEQGLLPLTEGPGASWVLDNDGVPQDRAAILLARNANLAKLTALGTNWSRLETGWSVSDNLPAHKPTAVRRAIECAGAELRFLPAYSPDFNPIEMAFSKLKAFLRKMRRGPSTTSGTPSPRASTPSHQPNARTTLPLLVMIANDRIML